MLTDGCSLIPRNRSDSEWLPPCYFPKEPAVQDQLATGYREATIFLHGAALRTHKWNHHVCGCDPVGAGDPRVRDFLHLCRSWVL